MKKFLVLAFVSALATYTYSQTHYVMDSSLTSGWNSSNQSYNPPSNRTLYHYNTAGKVTLSETFTSSSSTWIPQSKTYYGYNAGGILSSIYTLLWESTSSSFVSFQLDSNVYNGSGNLLYSQEYIWDKPDNTWKTKSSRSFNNNGLLQVSIDYNLDPISFVTETGTKIIYSYNSAKSVISVTTERLDTLTSTWKGETYVENHYTGDTLLVAFKTFDWDGSSYVPVFQDTIIYMNGDPTEHIQQKYNGSNWDNYYKVVSTYNTHHQSTLELEHHFTNNSWVAFGRTKNTYTATGKPDSIRMEASQLNQWVLLYIAHFEYDANDSNIVMTNMHYNYGPEVSWGFKRTTVFDIHHNVATTSFQGWDNIALTWYNNYKYDYYYSAFNIGIPEDVASTIRIFPTVLNQGGMLHLVGLKQGQSYTLKLFGADGKVHTTQLIRDHADFVLPSKLSTGIYFLEISAGMGLPAVRKLMVMGK